MHMFAWRLRHLDSICIGDTMSRRSKLVWRHPVSTEALPEAHWIVEIPTDGKGNSKVSEVYDVDYVQARMRSRTPVDRMYLSLIASGASYTRTSAHLNNKPYCDNPYHIKRSQRGTATQTSREVTMYVPCRKCEKCLQFRQMQWRERMIMELGRAKRTWFVTLTFDPIVMSAIMMASVRTSRNDGVDKQAFSHVQRYLKRVRKLCGPKFRMRYFACFERGEKNSRPHYHLLIHEVGERPVPYSVLQRCWPAKIFHAKLVASGDEGIPAYVTKTAFYATKDQTAPIRASLYYGRK